MSPDIYFMAKRMGVECPPLPFSTPDEFRQFNRQIRENPNVNAKWFEENAREYLPIADGKTKFCKTASMLQSHYDHSWKPGQLIKQARMGMGTSLKLLSDELSGVRILNPPGVDIGTKRIVSKEANVASSSFVPPLVAPFQTSEIKTRPQLERSCAWSPLCECRAEECGGWKKNGCQVYGRNGEKDPPTLEEMEIARKSRVLTASKSTAASKKKQMQSENDEEDQKNRDCAWFPYCTFPVSVCGGSKRAQCCVYGGVNPIFPPPDMTTDFVTKARKHKKALAVSLFREHKKNERATSQGKAVSPPHLLEPVTILGPMSTDRGLVVLSFRDTQNMLTSGSMLNDNVVQGYCNLIAQQFGSLGLHVRIVSPQFYPTFRKYGWERVQRWVQATQAVESDWTNAPLILVPTFTGPRDAGHWSGLIVDRIQGRIGTGICVYQDSLTASTALSASNMLKSQFTDTPVLPRNKEVTWITADTPVQARLSNDCAVHMCINFASYIKAVLDGCILSGCSTTSTTSITASTSRLDQISPLEWGKQGRRHLLESFRAGKVDLNHPVITLLEVRLHRT
jgi:hypothetical protein